MDENGVAIAVMGATGSGKTTFINLISHSSLRVGMGLRSCTSEVQTAVPFQLAGRTVTLIDTPGFDDTTKSDTDILKLIAAFLAATYNQGKKLAGVIYIHRISDFRMGGIAARNFTMFRKLCGDGTLKNVIIVTNMWGEVDRAVGEAREAELSSQDDFFKPALDKGAQMLRHTDTLDSACSIIQRIMGNTPRALRIQRELVDQGKDISQTSAGEELSRELAAQAQKHREEMTALVADMQSAIKEKDEETRRELEAEQRKLYAEMIRVQNDSQRLANDYKEEKARLEQEMARMAEEARRESERAAAEYQRQVHDFHEQLQVRNHASEAEREEIRGQLAEMQQRYEESERNRGNGCVIM